MYNKREGKEPRAYFQTWYEMLGDPLTFSPRWLDDVTNANCGCCTAGGGKRQQNIGARSGEKGVGKGFTLIGLCVLHGLSHGKRFRSSGEMRIALFFTASLLHLSSARGPITPHLPTNQLLPRTSMVLLPPLSPSPPKQPSPVLSAPSIYFPPPPYSGHKMHLGWSERGQFGKRTVINPRR